MRTRVALVVCLLVVATLALSLPAVAQDDGDGAGTDGVENVTVGQSISGFMQSTEASAQGDVDQGIYEARFEAANESEREGLVDDRSGDLETRLAAVESRIERIREDRNETNPVAYRARMSAAAAQLRALEASANRTERGAASVGVDASRLETLRTRANDLAGGEVAAIARSLAGAAPDEPGQGGPPGDAGPGDDPGPPDDTPGDAGNGSGPSDGTPGQGTGDDSPGQGSGDGDAGTGTGGNQGTGADGGEGAGSGGDRGTGNDGDQGSGTGGNQGTGSGDADSGTGNTGTGSSQLTAAPE